MPNYGLLSDEDQKKLEEMRAGINALAPSQAESTQAPAPVQQINQTAGSPRNGTLDKVLAMLSDRVMNDKPTPEEQAVQGQWAQLEKQKLTQLTGGGDTAQDWAVGLGTAIPMLAGTLMQTASPQRSRGIYGAPMESGLGKVAEAGIQGANNLMQQRQQREQANAQLAGQAQAIRKGNQDRDFDKLSKLATTLSERDRINIAMQQLGLRGTDNQLKMDAQAYRLDPKNTQAVQTRELIYKYRPELKGALDDLSIDGLKPFVNDASTNANFRTEYGQKVALASGQAAATTAAKIGTESTLAPVSASTEAEIAAARANALIAPEIKKQEEMSPILNERSNSGVGKGLDAETLQRDNPNLDFGDGEQLNRALKTRGINQKTLDDIKAANRGTEIIDRLHETAKQYQDLGVEDKLGPKGAELRRQYDAHAEEYAGVLGKLTGTSSESTRREALNLVPDIHNPYALHGIKGLWSSIEANANGNLQAIGGRATPPTFMRSSGAAQRANRPAPKPAAPSPSGGGVGAFVTRPKKPKASGLPTMEDFD